MIKNYFKIAFRNLWKNKAYSAINIFGLAIGLATCLLITLYVTDELNYDRFNEKAERIYRINSDLRFGGSDMHMTQTSDMMGPLLKKDYPQVEQYARVYTSEGSKLIKKGNQFINESRIAYVDSTFFDVFTLETIAGDPGTALFEPNTVVLTTNAANKYFNNTNAIGQTLEIKQGDATVPFKVTAVIKDLPKESHFNFEFFLSMKNARYTWGQLTSHNFHTYLLLTPGTNPKIFDKYFDEYLENYVFPYARQFMQVGSKEEFKKAGNKLLYTLMPLTDIHLHSDYTFEITPSGNIQYVYIFSAVAIFILLLACINFMNLSTARSAKRAKEVGIRKVLGTQRKTLVMQFLVESTLTAFIAMLAAILIAFLVMPLFNNMSGKMLQAKDLLSGNLLLVLILLPLVVGLLAGSYPAIFLSSFKPIIVLKGNTHSGFSKSHLRSFLVVFQFATTIILIIGTLVVFSQLRYIQNKKIGYDKTQVLIINDAYALNKNARVFKEAVLALPGVTNGTMSSFLPVSNSSRSDNTYSKEAVMTMESGIDMQSWEVDYDYLETMGMELASGRNFSKDYGTDSNAILITETTAKLLDYKDPVGKMIYAPSGKQSDNSLYPLQIIGVVKDFHFESLKQKLGPLCMRLENSTGLASFKVSTINTKDLITAIESKWKSLAPGLPFSYRFLNESFNDMYNSERRAGTIATSFSVLAILIAALGLFGLVTFMAEQRTKEIGIRKVLGASVANILSLLSKDFMVLVLIASVIAFPVAWWAMHTWLQDFEYRINISAWVFVVAALTALVIALATISFQAIRAAMSNPVKSLRTE